MCVWDCIFWMVECGVLMKGWSVGGACLDLVSEISKKSMIRK